MIASKISKEKSRRLDNDHASSMIGSENPLELIVPNQGIAELGNLSEMGHLRKLDLSFNPISSLIGLEQLGQLRHIHSYCCELTELEIVAVVPKLETLFVHQNGIKSIPTEFRALSKLRHFRADKNQISKLQNLNKCASLRILDLSWNRLSSLDGISGLQSLQELRVNNNSISSLKPLRGLPSLIELQCIGNQIQSLDGLQHVPTLECLHVEHNRIATTHIPTSSTREGQSLDRDTKEKASSLNGDSSSEVMPQLTELYINGNAVQELSGPECLGSKLEVCDLSHNVLKDGLYTVSILTRFPLLSEVRVTGNPCVPDESLLVSLAEGLASACPILRSVDHLVIVSGRVVGQGTGAANAPDPEPFFTWDREEGEESKSEVPLRDEDEDEDRSQWQDSDSSDSDSSYEAYGSFRNRDPDPISDPNLHQDEGRNAPRLNLEHVLAEPEVQAMGNEFHSLIEVVRARMLAAARELESEEDAEFRRMQERLQAQEALQTDVAAHTETDEVVVTDEPTPAESPRVAAGEGDVSTSVTPPLDAAEKIRQILRSKVPVPFDKRAKAAAELSTAALTTTAARRTAGGAEVKSVKSKAKSHRHSAGLTDRQAILEREVALLAKQYGSQQEEDGMTETAASDSATVVSQISNISKHPQRRHPPKGKKESASAAPTYRGWKAPSRLLDDDGPTRHSSGLSLHGSRTKHTHHGHSAPVVHKLPKEDSQDRALVASKTSSKSKRETARGSKSRESTGLVDEVDVFDREAVQQAQNLLAPASSNSVIGVAVAQSEALALLEAKYAQSLTPSKVQTEAQSPRTPSPPRADRVPSHRVSPKVLLQRGRTDNPTGAPADEKMGSVCTSVPSSPISTARPKPLEEKVKVKEKEKATPAQPRRVAGAQKVVNAGNASKGFQDFSGVMSRVADPRFASRGVRSLSELLSQQEAAYQDALTHTASSSALLRNRTEGADATDAPTRQVTVPTLMIPTALSHSTNALLSSSSPHEKENCQPLALEVVDMDDDLPPTGRSVGRSNSGILSARTLARPKSAGMEAGQTTTTPRFRIPREAAVMLAAKSDLDPPLIEGLTQISIAAPVSMSSFDA